MATSNTEIEARKLRKRELSQIASKLAKTANSRLRALEEKGLERGSNAYRYIEKLHFDKDNATATDSQGRMKFNTDFRGLSYQDLQHLIGEIQGFLGAKTSKVSGVKKKYYKAWQSYSKETNEKTGGSSISFADFTDIMRNQKIKDSKEMFGSKLFVRVIRHIDETGESVKQALERIKDLDVKKADMLDLEDELTKEMPWQKSQDGDITDGGNIT